MKWKQPKKKFDFSENLFIPFNHAICFSTVTSEIFLENDILAERTHKSFQSRDVGSLNKNPLTKRAKLLLINQ